MYNRVYKIKSSGQKNLISQCLVGHYNYTVSRQTLQLSNIYSNNIRQDKLDIRTITAPYVHYIKYILRYMPRTNILKNQIEYIYFQTKNFRFIQL